MHGATVNVLNAYFTGKVTLVHGSCLEVHVTHGFQLPGREDHGGSCVQAQVVTRQQHAGRAGIDPHRIVVRRPVRFTEGRHRKGHAAAHPALVTQSPIAVVGEVVQDRIPALGRDGGGRFPMEFIAAQRRFGADGVHGAVAVGLAQFVGLHGVFIKEQEIKCIVNDDRLHFVHVTGCEHPQIHDDANPGVHVDGRCKVVEGSRQTTGGCTAPIGRTVQRDERQHEHERHGHQTHGRFMHLGHFNDWVPCSPKSTPHHG